MKSNKALLLLGAAAAVANVGYYPSIHRPQRDKRYRSEELQAELKAKAELKRMRKEAKRAQKVNAAGEG